jgi:hypothetical protein
MFERLLGWASHKHRSHPVGTAKRRAEEALVVERSVIHAAFMRWVEATGFADLWASVPENDRVILTDALEEMIELTPQLFDDWWIRNHYRYGWMREIERRKVRQLAATFFAALAAGRVDLMQ